MAPETFFASEPILALRTWSVHLNQLLGWTFPTTWPAAAPLIGTCDPGQSAFSPTYTPSYRCRIDRNTSAPHEAGRCGIYGVAVERIADVDRGPTTFFRTLLDYVVHSAFSGSYVAGAVALWGRVLLSENGIYRAELAYPVALFAAKGLGPLTKAYGVPVVPVPTSLDALRSTFEWVRGQLKEVPSDEPR